MYNKLSPNTMEESPKQIFENTEGMPDGLQFFTYEEVARIMRVQRATVRSWVYRGIIRSNVKMGKKSLVPKSELQRLVAERTMLHDKKVFPVREDKQQVVPPPEGEIKNE